jgi:hypothetical protein
MSSPTKTGTVALIVRYDGREPSLLETLSDDREIALFEQAATLGEADPLAVIAEMRERQKREDDEFGNYVEELLCQPAVRPEILEHGVQWLKSKAKIEAFQKTEREATCVIAQYAYKMFQENPWRKDFLLAGPTAQVRIKILIVPGAGSKADPNSSAA